MWLQDVDDADMMPVNDQGSTPYKCYSRFLRDRSAWDLIGDQVRVISHRDVFFLKMLSILLGTVPARKEKRDEWFWCHQLLELRLRTRRRGIRTPHAVVSSPWETFQ